jgi:hypothetical protein
MSAQILEWKGTTKLDFDADKILATALADCLESAVVVGWKNGDLYFSSSHASASETIFLLQRAIHVLNVKMDELTR